MTLLIPTIVTVFEILGVLSAIVALFHPRTSQGTIAWIVSLLAFPYVAVPLFWIFGRTRFHGYVSARQSGDSNLADVTEMLRAREVDIENIPSYHQGRLLALKRLAKLPYTQGNDVREIAQLYVG